MPGTKDRLESRLGLREGAERPWKGAGVLVGTRLVGAIFLLVEESEFLAELLGRRGLGLDSTVCGSVTCSGMLSLAGEYIPEIWDLLDPTSSNRLTSMFG